MFAKLIFILYFNFNIFCREIVQDSDQREFPVQKNDIIILSSDGLYDVVPDNVIESIVKSFDERVSFYKILE